MTSLPSSDLALAFDSARFRADVVIVDGDLVLSNTPVTPVLVSLGSDRRAATDDVLPSGVSPLNMPASWSERRGWWGDALDRFGRLIGSRLWLLDRAKATEETRRLAEAYVAESLAWLKTEYDIEPQIEVTIERRNTPSPVLAIRVSLPEAAVNILRKLQ